MGSDQNKLTSTTDLRSWQASNCPILADRKPETLFTDAAFVKAYKKLHRDLWHRMIRLHGTLHTLDELLDFPFDDVYGPQDMEFWRLVYSNFFDMACVILNGMLNDHGSDSHTILKFKNRINNESWNDEQLKEAYQDYMREIKFEQEIRASQAKVKGVRDHMIAHRLLDQDSGEPIEQLIGVNLDELRSLFRAVHRLFGAVTFGSSYVTLAGDLKHKTVGGKPSKTCLQTVLAAVLRDSFYVNAPEKRGRWWEIDREHMSQDQIDGLNKHRKSVGLPPA